MNPTESKKNHKMGRARLVDSFQFAWQGVRFAFLHEQNFRIHVVMAVLAICAGLFFGINIEEWAVLIVIMGIVLAAELFNTAIEATIDLQTTELHPLAKIAKDSASAAVLILSVVAFVVGLIIFIPRLIPFVQKLL